MNKYMVMLTGMMALFSMPEVVFAHPGLAEAGHFRYGFQHPFLGLDHFLVMTGLGLWLSRQSLVYRLCGVAVFLGVMLMGTVVAANGVSFAYVETAVLLSVLLTGLLLATSLRQPSGESGLMMIGLAAFMHGQAHGSEMPVSASLDAYVVGFVAATLVLQTAGLVCGRLMLRYRVERLSRLYGGLTGLAGLWLLLNA